MKSLPQESGWYPWREGRKSPPEPRFVCDVPGKGLCVMQWKQTAVPVAEIGGLWGKRIKGLDSQDPEEGR